ncbi:cytidylyltransferase domain-containing protein [Halorussus aquaticus]|uniref:Cytidylyltransferase domain-containing protein n=1 Tax=Halorussus aquaticus TaxID=2953748 RepID=A0ABD5PZW6_9EURY|nr:glycosyltransferase family protein [Halorussus aquaticus]
MRDRTVAIVQARMGSTRLPEKVLADIGDEPMLWHVHERARSASLVDDVVVATSTESQDDAVAEFCEERGITYNRGSEEDVLDRYYETATDTDADVVVRITGDCPFLSPPVLDRVVRTYENGEADYVTNTLEYTHPDGLDVEVFGYEALERAWNEADDPAEREHVTYYLRESDEFSSQNVENVVDTSMYEFTDEDTILRWTVDYPADLEFVRAVYDRLTERGHWLFDQQSVFELLEREPALRDVNEDR